MRRIAVCRRTASSGPGCRQAVVPGARAQTLAPRADNATRAPIRSHSRCRAQLPPGRPNRPRQASSLTDDLAGGGVNALAVDEASGRVGALRAPEEQDVRLRPARKHTSTQDVRECCGSSCWARYKRVAGVCITRRSQAGGRHSAAGRGGVRARAATARQLPYRFACGSLCAPVDGVVDPSAALLHAEATPLRFGEQATLGGVLRDVLRQDHMPARGGVRFRP